MSRAEPRSARCGGSHPACEWRRLRGRWLEVLSTDRRKKPLDIRVLADKRRDSRHYHRPGHECLTKRGVCDESDAWTDLSQTACGCPTATIGHVDVDDRHPRLRGHRQSDRIGNPTHRADYG